MYLFNFNVIHQFLGNNPNYKSIAQHCNLWRNFDDIYDSWDSVLGIINYYGDDKVVIKANQKLSITMK